MNTEQDMAFVIFTKSCSFENSPKITNNLDSFFNFDEPFGGLRYIQWPGHGLKSNMRPKKGIYKRISCPKNAIRGI